MTSALFIGIGAFEVFAVLTTALRLFRFKVIWYLRDITIMSIVLAGASYLMRMVLDVAWLDMPLAIMAVVVFMRFVIKVKPQYAVILTLAGYASYIAVQSLVFLLLSVLIGLDSDLLTETHGAQIYLLQLATAGLTMIIAYFMNVVGFGFTFIIHPPHSTTKLFNSKKEKTVLYGTIATFMILTAALSVLLTGYGWIAYIIAITNFSLLYWLLHRRSEED